MICARKLALRVLQGKHLPYSRVLEPMKPGAMQRVRRVCFSSSTLIFLLCSAADSQKTWDRVGVALDASEAERVLDILAKRKAGQTITERDWQALFATEPYQRLKKRESAMHRQFTDEDFKKFVLSDDLAKQQDAL